MTQWVSAGNDFRVTSERNTNPGPEEDCSVGLNLQQEDLLSSATVKTILGTYFKLKDVIHLEEEVTVTERILISYVWELLMLNGLWSVSDWSLQNACFYPFRTKIINRSIFDIIFECIERLFLSFDVFLIIWVAPCKTSLLCRDENAQWAKNGNEGTFPQDSTSSWSHDILDRLQMVAAGGEESELASNPVHIVKAGANELL